MGDMAALVAKVKTKLKEVDVKVRAWVAAQPPAVEVALVAAASAVQGSAIGVLMGSFTADLANSMPQPPPGVGGAALNPEAQQAMKQMQALSSGPWTQARNFAVMTGVNAGISCALRKVRRIPSDDLQTSMAAALGSGIAFALVSGVGPPAAAGTAAGAAAPNVLANVLSTGVAFAIFQGALFQAGQFFSGRAGQGSQEASEYEQTSSMLHSLGLKKYEKNFKKGLLTDRTLPLLNDSALQEVRIPPGPRLLILAHVKRSSRDVWPEEAVAS